MLDPLLLKKEDLNVYRDLSANMDDSRVEQSIRESQIDEMSNFLGEELYLKLMLDWDGVTFPNADYLTLWEGEDYILNNKQIRYHGLKPAIALYAYSRMLDNIQVNVVRAGVVTFDTEESTPAEQAQIATKVKSAKGQALVYLARADKYLQANSTVYPEYVTKDTDVINKTSFTIFKA